MHIELILSWMRFALDVHSVYESLGITVHPAPNVKVYRAHPIYGIALKVEDRNDWVEISDIHVVEDSNGSVYLFQYAGEEDHYRTTETNIDALIFDKSAIDRPAWIP